MSSTAWFLVVLLFVKSTVRFKCWWLSPQPCSWSSATRSGLNTQDSSLTPFRNHVLISITFDIGQPWATEFSSSVMSSASSCAAHVNSETPLFGTRQPLGMVTCHTQCLSTCTGAIQISRKTWGSQQLFYFRILRCRAKGIPKNNIWRHCMYGRLLRRDLVH